MLIHEGKLRARDELDLRDFRRMKTGIIGGVMVCLQGLEVLDFRELV